MSQYPGTPTPNAEDHWQNAKSGLLPTPPLLEGRITILDVTPSVESGRRPAKAAAGQTLTVSTLAFRDGHDAIGVNVVLNDPSGHAVSNTIMDPTSDPDRWIALVQIPNDADISANWSFTIEAWSNPIATWLHRADIKVPSGIDAELELLEGAILLENASTQTDSTIKEALQDIADTLRSQDYEPVERLERLTPSIREMLQENPIRDLVTKSGPWPLQVDRRRALVGAWYELFPRSEGATPGVDGGLVSGSFNTAAKRLEAIADMGFDVVYLPPIHPIGKINRKGRNNSVETEDGDVGSPWAIGSDEGGHQEVHPDLGTLDDFDAFVSEAARHKLEIALDLALQVAPDHPWATQGKPWFVERADGSIAFAENPPKKYQDIYPMWFDGDPQGIEEEVLRVIRFWAARGIRIFRVDNPHTKPVQFWDRVLAEVRATDPDIIFLAEAFTRPPMMRALAEVGYHQSYTYFTWRTEKDELTEYLDELSGPSSQFMRPNLFVNTPDILHASLQYGGPAEFAIRATLAATLAPSWGMYAGFELFEHVAVKAGSEEYLNSEKYELRPRDWEAAKTSNTLIPYVTILNDLRRKHPALQDLTSLTFHPTDSGQIICYSKQDGDDLVIVVCSLDSFNAHEATIYFDLEALGLEDGDQFRVKDEISGASWLWSPATYVRLDPLLTCAHIVSVTRGAV